MWHTRCTYKRKLYMHLELNLLPLLLLTNAVAPLVRHRALSANICLCAVCQCILRVPTRRLLPPSLSSLPICRSCLPGAFIHKTSAVLCSVCVCVASYSFILSDCLCIFFRWRCLAQYHRTRACRRVASTISHSHHTYFDFSRNEKEKQN